MTERDDLVDATCEAAARVLDELAAEGTILDASFDDDIDHAALQIAAGVISTMAGWPDTASEIVEWLRREAARVLGVPYE